MSTLPLSPTAAPGKAASSPSRSPAAPPALLPRITVVVCTYNRSAMLRAAVRSLLSLTTEDRFAYDVLVIDNNSTDDTQACLAALKEKSAIPLRTVVETERGVVAARNRGLREATGDWIAFFDDDQLADPRWLLELLALAEERQCGCVGGAVALALPPGCERKLAPFCRLLLSETVGMDAPQPYDRRTTPGTGNAMVHRSVVDRVGGFNAAMHDRAEDTEFFLRILDADYAIWYSPRAIIHHVIPADRLNDDYFLAIARKMGSNLAYLERDAWGWLFSGRWLLRLLQAYGWFWPQWCWAQWTGDGEQRLALRCRLELSQAYLSRGWTLLTAGG